MSRPCCVLANVSAVPVGTVKGAIASISFCCNISNSSLRFDDDAREAIGGEGM
jgi:hypothetical protein